MAQLLYKTRGNTTAQGKPRVYFTCAEQDWEQYFETVTEEILRHSDCAVYYYEPHQELDAQDLTDLHQMQLFARLKSIMGEGR